MLGTQAAASAVTVSNSEIAQTQSAAEFREPTLL